MMYESDHKLGLLQWGKGASLICYRIRLPSHYEKSINLHLQKFIGKSQKPLLNQNNLSPSLTFSLLQCSHITYLTHQDTAYQSSELDIITSLCHVSYISEYIYLHIFRVNILLKRHLSRGHRISCPAQHLERTDSKPSSRLIGPTHIKKQGNFPLKLLARCSSCILQFSESI